MSRHLEGIRVVELGTNVAVPKVSRVMADWGAEVIKVEPPKGEPLRWQGVGYDMPVEPDHNPIFEVENMNKKAVTINLKTPEGHDAMIALLKSADVFVTNTRLKVLTRLGLDYETVRRENPKLIYGHFGAYGTKGPQKDDAGFDVASFWAKSGALIEWTLDSDTPFKPQPGLGDTACSAHMLSAVLASLFRRERTGEGEFLQTSLYANALWCNSIGVICGQPQYHHTYPKKQHTDPLFAPYRCKDGVWMTVCSPDWETLYRKVFPLIGLEAYIGDPKLDTKAAVQENYDEAAALIREAWGSYTSDEIQEKFSAAGLIMAKFENPNDLYQDEQAWANDFLACVTLRDGTELIVPRTPVQFADEEVSELRIAPPVGADNEEILSGLGLTAEQIEKATK